MLEKPVNRMNTLRVESVGEVISKYADGHPMAGQSILDNNGNPNEFRKVTFSVATELDDQGREVMSTARPRSRNIWKNTNPDLFSKLRAGMHVKGRIVTEECAPYELNGRTVNTITFIQFEDETVQQAMNNTGRARASERNTRLSVYDDPTIQPGQYPKGEERRQTVSASKAQDSRQDDVDDLGDK
jgi:hypothetical protein